MGIPIKVFKNKIKVRTIKRIGEIQNILKDGLNGPIILLITKASKRIWTLTHLLSFHMGPKDCPRFSFFCHRHSCSFEHTCHYMLFIMQHDSTIRIFSNLNRKGCVYENPSLIIAAYSPKAWVKLVLWDVLLFLETWLFMGNGLLREWTHVPTVGVIKLLSCNFVLVGEKLTMFMSALLALLIIFWGWKNRSLKISPCFPNGTP